MGEHMDAWCLCSTTTQCNVGTNDVSSERRECMHHYQRTTRCLVSDNVKISNAACRRMVSHQWDACVNADRAGSWGHQLTYPDELFGVLACGRGWIKEEVWPTHGDGGEDCNTGDGVPRCNIPSGRTQKGDISPTSGWWWDGVTSWVNRCGTTFFKVGMYVGTWKVWDERTLGG